MGFDYTLCARITGLYVCNESGKPIKVALAAFQNQTWLSQGWASARYGECVQLTTHLMNSVHYLYAVDVKGKSWEGDHSFCINQGGDFVIRNAENIRSCLWKNFFSIWVPSLVEPVFPEHYEVIIGPRNFNLNNPRAERNK